MKRFIDYLVENAEHTKYAFKIKIAGPLPENCEDCIESALNKYNVNKFTKGNRTPIQENLIDFPEIKNAEMTIFEAEVDYPATSVVVLELISQTTGIPKECIRVRTPQEETNWEIENEYTLAQKELTKDNKPLLCQDYEKTNSQHLVGDKHVSNFLKELMKDRKGTAPATYSGANTAMLAKKLHKEKANMMPAAGPARSLFGGNKKD